MLLLLLFWVGNILAILNSSGIKDAIVFSVLMIIFAVVFISAFVKGVYIVVENNSVKYVHMFLLKKEAEITKINKIQKTIMGGMYNSLSLIYEDNEGIKDIKISVLSFKKDVLKQLLADLKIQNPHIEIDQSVNEFISN